MDFAPQAKNLKKDEVKSKPKIIASYFFFTYYSQYFCAGGTRSQYFCAGGTLAQVCNSTQLVVVTAGGTAFPRVLLPPPPPPPPPPPSLPTVIILITNIIKK